MYMIWMVSKYSYHFAGSYIHVVATVIKLYPIMIRAGGRGVRGKGSAKYVILVSKYQYKKCKIQKCLVPFWSTKRLAFKLLQEE